ncbi:serine--tRNA ligase, partial [bacterium]
RMRMKYNDGKKTDYVHTLNASGIATPRTMIALLEHYEHDGVIEIPEVLRKYMGGIERIE